MLEVLVHGCLLSQWVFFQHGAEAGLLAGGFAMQSRVESGVAGVVFGFERDRRHGGLIDSRKGREWEGRLSAGDVE